MKNVKWLRFFGAALFWLIIWYLVAKKQGTELLLPYPMSVLRRLSELVVTAEFWRIAMTSLFRIFTAFLTGAAIGSAAAAACAVSKIFKALVSPAMTVIRATPIASFIILLLLWLPSAGSVSLWAAVLMTAPIFWANLSRAIETVDPRLLEMAKVYH
ncbi:MAG: ABC transporter permease, partial [Oscillospiraceae bacterium]